MQPEFTKRASWPLYLIGALFVVAILSLAAWNVELPYIGYTPGPVSDASDDIVAQGVPLYPPKGELLMLTVVTIDVNVFEALIAGTDPTIDLVRRQAVRREGETAEEYRNRVLQQMDDSNYRAIYAAMQYLGYEMEPTEVVINEIVEGVPAADVLQLGDTISVVDGHSIASVEDIGPALEGYEVGDVVPMTIERAGSSIDVQVVLAERTDEPGVPMIGIVPGQLLGPPFPIEIESGDVGGPSAGLMHTLAIIDDLTETDLTGGRIIAGTGTIGLDGEVGIIGGVRQKVVAAEAAGAELMLVPEGNYATALTAERQDMELVPVKTLDDAVQYLKGLGPA